MKLSVAIAARNIRELLRNCLNSLRPASTGEPVPPVSSMEVIVVDDCSSDGTAEMVRSEFPEVRLIRNDENLGFARSSNKGLLESGGDYLALLNADTVVPRGGLERLVAFLEEHPEVWAVGPKLVYPTGGVQPSCSTFLQVRYVLFEQLFLDKLFRRSRLFGGHFLTWWDYSEPREVDVLSGACIVAPRRTWEQVGLLDENYFLYCDDPDWCLRVHQAGGKCFFLPDVEIVHYVGATSQANRGPAILAYNRSRCYYFRKFHGERAAELVRKIAVFGAGLRLALWGGKALLGSLAAREQAKMWRSVLKGLCEIDVHSLPDRPVVPSLR